MYFSKKICQAFWLAGCLVAIVGCGGASGGNPNRPQVVPVKGTVTYKQQPVEGAAVLFVSENGNPGATGVTNASGEFQLRTFEPNDGAVPGSYKVTITKFDAKTPATNPAQSDQEAEMGYDRDEPAPMKSLLPERYGDTTKTDLKAEVSAEGDNHLQFDLKD